MRASQFYEDVDVSGLILDTIRTGDKEARR